MMTRRANEINKQTNEKNSDHFNGQVSFFFFICLLRLKFLFATGSHLYEGEEKNRETKNWCFEVFGPRSDCIIIDE